MEASRDAAEASAFQLREHREEDTAVAHLRYRTSGSPIVVGVHRRESGRQRRTTTPSGGSSRRSALTTTAVTRLSAVKQHLYRPTAALHHRSGAHTSARSVNALGRSSRLLHSITRSRLAASAPPPNAPLYARSALATFAHGLLAQPPSTRQQERDEHSRRSRCTASPRT